MAAPTRAVLLDALGTLVELEPPFERLYEALGGEVPIERVESGMRREMAYYREHSHEGRDERSLAELRGRCAELLGRELGREVGVEAMMSAIRFRAYPDAAGALGELRGLGLALVCVSNWDCSLPGVLDRDGLRELLDGVVVSATAGARKPDPAIFRAALELAGCGAAEALVVGDTEDEDVAGGRAAGIPALLLDRGSVPEVPGTSVPREGSAPQGSDPRGVPKVSGTSVPVISSLRQIRDHLFR